MPTVHRGNPLRLPGEESSERCEIALRAADFLNANIRGDAVNKRVAQALECHPDTAYLLRRGECWTAKRLGQAARAFGRAFTDFVFFGAAAELRPYESALIDEMQALLARAQKDRAEAVAGNAPTPAAPGAAAPPARRATG